MFRYVSSEDGRVPLCIQPGRLCSVMYPTQAGLVVFRYVSHSSRAGRVPLCIPLKQGWSCSVMYPTQAGLVVTSYQPIVPG